MLGLLSNSVKIRKPSGLVGVEIVRRLVKKENSLIIISVLSVSEKKTSYVYN